MASRLSLLLFVGLCLLAAPLDAQNLEIDAKKRVLDNGLTVLVVERPVEPTATCWLFYRTGSVNERPGITGISHLFEHMMFKGTRRLGVKDLKRDQEIMDRLDALWMHKQGARAAIDAEFLAEVDRLRETVGGLERQVEEGKVALEKGEYKGQKIPPEMIGFAKTMLERGEKELTKAQEEYQALQQGPEYASMTALEAIDAEWKALQEEQRANVIKDELWETYLKNGGTMLNAFTSHDVTAYIVTLPKNRTELFMWLEADRMEHAVFREFYSERDVVKEERRLTENRPLGFYDESMNALFFQAHPYQWPVLGWMSDLNAITRKDLREYFAIHYAPNNAVMVVVGDVAADAIFDQAERYFARIPRGKPKMEVRTVEPEQKGEKRFFYQAETDPQVDLWYHIPQIGHRDLPALMLLGDVLSGKTGRLYKRMVEGDQIALSVSAGAGRPRQFPGSFDISAVAKGEVTPERLEAVLDEELAKIKEGGVEARELQRVKNQRQAEYVRGLRSNTGLTAQIGFAESIYRWEYLNEAPKLIGNVSAQDVVRVATQYFTRENRLVGIVRRKPSDPGDKKPAGKAGAPKTPGSGDDYRAGALGGFDPGFWRRVFEDERREALWPAFSARPDDQAWRSGDSCARLTGFMASLEPPLQPGLARRIPDDGDEDEEAAPRGPVSRLLYRLAQRAQQGEARLQELLGHLRGGQGKAPPAALIPDHPRDLSYPDLEFLVPQAGEYRHEFDNGLVLYLIEDHELPTLDLELMVRTGERYNEDRAKWGLADLTADMLRRGGTVSFTEEEIDEKLDFIAGRLSSFAGYDQATISLSVMAKDADFGLDLLAETLLKPRFDEKKLARHKERTIERMKSRNDSPPAILSREFTRLIYGAGHSRAWNTRKSAIERLSRADLRDWHRREYQPDRAILVASGDFETNAFLSALKKRLGAWKATPRAAIPKLPRPQTAKPGVYLIEKDTNQGYVSFGHLSVKRDNPDYHALQVMNFILGGGSFTSRMMSKVRSDEGLAYSVYSRFGAEDEEPGVFFAGVQSKSSTVAFAIELMFAEIERMRGELVGEAELESAKSSFIERFPSTFGSRMGTVQALAELEFRNRPADYYNTYRDKIRAVTAEDVRRVAREYLKPEKMVIGVVGQPDELLKGDGVHKKLADFGPITRVPLLDPLGDDF